MPSEKKAPWRLEESGGRVSIAFKTIQPSFPVGIFFLGLGLLIWAISGFLFHPEWIKLIVNTLRERMNYDLVSGIVENFPYVVLLPAYGVYTIAAGLVNSYRVRCSGGVLTASYGFFPWPFYHRLRVEKILQVFCVKDGKYTSVRALLASGRTVVLLPRALDTEAAWQAEAALERALGIADTVVHGETAAPDAVKTPGKPDLWAPPKGMRFTRNGKTSVLQYHPNNLGGILCLFFGTAMAVIDGVMIHSGMLGELIVLFLFLSLLGLTAFYIAFAMLLNRFTITANPQEIIVNSGPLPWCGCRRYPAPGIKDVFFGVREKTGRITPGVKSEWSEIFINYGRGNPVSVCGRSMNRIGSGDGSEFMTWVLMDLYELDGK